MKSIKNDLLESTFLVFLDIRQKNILHYPRNYLKIIILYFPAPAKKRHMAYPPNQMPLSYSIFIVIILSVTFYSVFYPENNQ